MVATPHVDRCETCRKRKVKCDQRWPICTPCEKSRRHCTGPPARYKFMKTSSVVPFTQNAVQSTEGASLRDVSSQVVVLAASERVLVRLGSKSKNGGHFQKMRLIDTIPSKSAASTHTGAMAIPQRVPWSPVEELAQELITSMSLPPVGYNQKSFLLGDMFAHLPQRLGNSKALDAATEVLVRSFKACIFGKAPPSEWMPLGPYSRAIQNLHDAVKDPIERYSPHTLAAILLMWRMEGIFSYKPQLLTKGHIQAIFELVKTRGCSNLEDPFDFFLILECQPAIISYCLYADVPCFIDSESWKSALAMPQGRSHIAMLYWAIFDEMTKWRDLLKAIKTVRTCSDAMNATLLPGILAQTIQMSQRLRSIDLELGELIDGGEYATVEGSQDPLVPTAYNFKDPSFAAVLSWHATFTMAINRCVQHVLSLISQVSQSPRSTEPSSADFQILHSTSLSENLIFPQKHATNHTDEESSSLHAQYEERNKALSRRVWMCYNHVRDWKPFWCVFLYNPLRSSRRYAGSEEMLSWIRACEQDLCEKLPWPDDMISGWCEKLCGEDVF